MYLLKNRIFNYIILLMLLNIITYGQESSTYYIDSRFGNDLNSGLSIEKPWKTLLNINKNKFLPGSKILLKRGEVWTQSSFKIHSSGIKDNPITISSYGSKLNSKPIISSLISKKFKWKKLSNNMWSISIEKEIYRLFMNTKELLPARLKNELSDRQRWFYENNSVILYSISNPSSNTFTYSNKDPFRIINQQYIIIDNIELIGGRVFAMSLVGSSYIDIKNMTIGEKSYFGIKIRPSKKNPIVSNILIENSIFDTHFTLDYSFLNDIGKGSDNIGAADGVSIKGGVINTILRNNYFKNWNHASISLESKKEKIISNNKIYNNFLTSPDIAYGGRIGISGRYTFNNEIYSNIIENISVRNQIGGYDNYFHNNTIDKVRNSSIRKKNIGQCISLEPYNGNVYRNRIEHNILKNCDGAGIKLISYGSKKKLIYDNSIKYNTIINCGRSQNSKKEGGLHISKYINIKKKNIKNNTLIPDVVFYNNKYIDIKNLNKLLQ